MKPKLLFLDDRWKRIKNALERYSDDFCVTVVTNPRECLRHLSCEEFAQVHLDCDLNGEDFVSLASQNSVMEVLNYLRSTGWPPSKRKPQFVIHSSNEFAAYATMDALQSLGMFAVYERFVYDNKTYRVGIVAGTFDLIHPGYIRMFQDAKTLCEYLIVALQTENIKKPKPVFSVEERREILSAIKYVDEIHTYQAEEELEELLILLNPDIRILGSDYWDESRTITGKNICPIYYHERKHTFSTSAVKEKIWASIQTEKGLKS